MKAIAIIAVGAVSLFGVASCSSDTKLDSSSGASTPEVSTPDVSIPDISIPDISLPAGVSIPDISIPDISIPANFTGQCKEWATAFASVISGGNSDTFNDLDQVFADLKDSAPDDLKEDVDVVAEGFAKLGVIYKKYNYDFTKAATDPDLQKFFSDPDFTDSSEKVSTWLDTKCGTGS